MKESNCRGVYHVDVNERVPATGAGATAAAACDAVASVKPYITRDGGAGPAAMTLYYHTTQYHSQSGARAGFVILHANRIFWFRSAKSWLYNSNINE